MTKQIFTYRDGPLLLVVTTAYGVLVFGLGFMLCIESVSGRATMAHFLCFAAVFLLLTVCMMPIILHIDRFCISADESQMKMRTMFGKECTIRYDQIVEFSKEHRGEGVYVMTVRGGSEIIRWTSRICSNGRLCELVEARSGKVVVEKPN